MDLELLLERAKIIRLVRSFFDKKNYLETDTPLLSPDLIPESCLEVFETLRLQPHGSKKEAQRYWLIPSPEIWMKKLIARHRASLYQICKCFRNGESSGRFHSPEFTMLEYYTMNADYLDSLKITEDMFGFLISQLSGKDNSLSELTPPFERISMEEAFERWAGFSLFEAAENKTKLESEARRLGLDPPPGLQTPELYDLIFIHAVEPNISRSRPVVLTDYPNFVPCLAKKHKSGRTFERWELYVRGIELANCFTEETDADEVRRFFESEKKMKEKSAIVRHNTDGDYWKVFKEGGGFPSCSGVALGLDRLIMALLGRSSIDMVLPFPLS
ncbi:MAG: LysR family transcriptional regulator [Treponema sp.]|jgi:lysyl-tRNA synthetase class 2|nr:LysR family transcriptional regulator [Treponema sp.]